MSCRSGRVHGLAGSSRADWRCFRWSGGGVGHGDDGGGDAGDGVPRARVREGGRGLGLAGAVPVPVDDVPVFSRSRWSRPGSSSARGGSRTGPRGRHGRRTGPGPGPRARRGVPSARARRRGRRHGRPRGSARRRRPRPRVPAGPGPGSRSGASARCRGRRRAAAPWPPAVRSPTRPTAIYRAQRARERGIPRQSIRSVTRQNISGTS